jgi:hypothetical protein
MKTSRTLSPAKFSRVRLVNGITATVWIDPKSILGSRKTTLDDLDELVAGDLDELVAGDLDELVAGDLDELVAGDLDELVAHPAETRRRRSAIPKWLFGDPLISKSPRICFFSTLRPFQKVIRTVPLYMSLDVVRTGPSVFRFW